MTLEDFAKLHSLPDEWLKLRHECEGIVLDPQFWSNSELQTAARLLALRASDLLRDAIRKNSGTAPKESCQAVEP